MIRELADVIHAAQCGDGDRCVRYNRGKVEVTSADFATRYGDVRVRASGYVEGLPAGRAEAHYDWYMARAAAVHDRLAPDIGSANVLPCVQAVIEELRAG